MIALNPFYLDRRFVSYLLSLIVQGIAISAGKTCSAKCKGLAGAANVKSLHMLRRFVKGTCPEMLTTQMCRYSTGVCQVEVIRRKAVTDEMQSRRYSTCGGGRCSLESSHSDTDDLG